MSRSKYPFKTTKQFEKMYIVNFNKMYAIARSKINDPEIAKNLIHDIFLKLWEKRSSTQIEGKVENYLLGATKKAILQYYRDKIAHQQKIENLVIKGVSNDTSETILLNDLRAQLESSLDTLPEKCKQTFILSRYEGMKNKEIAAELNISLKTVEYHMNRALKHLHKNLDC